MTFFFPTPADRRADFLAGFDRHQVVTRCWRCRNGQWYLADVPFTEEWDAEELQAQSAALFDLLDQGGWCCAARDDDGVILGYAALAGGFMPSQSVPTARLDMLEVSASARRCALGTRLFAEACREAARRGAVQLYLSAHSSEESQAFYRAVGCIPAASPDPAMAALEPCDVQMVRPLTLPLPLAVLFPPDVPDADIRFSIMMAREENAYLLCRRADRTTWECPGGHREPGETPDQCAHRELWEETGAEDYVLTPAFPYVVWEGIVATSGMAYTALIRRRGALSPMEIAECRRFSVLPDAMTYPQIQPRLIHHAEEVGLL